MNVVDHLHPEELIDKLSAGKLSSAERERLDAHLAQCSSCRFELEVRDDFALDAESIEPRPQIMLSGEIASDRTLPIPARRAPISARARLRRRWPLVMVAAAFVLCAGGATAAVLTGTVHAPRWLKWSPEPKAADGAGQSASAKGAQKSKHVLPKAAEAKAVAAGSAALVSEATPPFVPPVVAPPAAPRPVLVAARPTSQGAHLASTATFPVAPAVPAPALSTPVASAPVEVPRVDPAAALFADANRARRDGNADRAVALYRSLQSRFPSSSESEVSRALLAQLLLERGNPDAALAGFDRYLAADAPVLGAEALVGRARALEQLGKSAQAAAAWKEVQSRFPGSVHARLAATRLAALGTR